MARRLAEWARRHADEQAPRFFYAGAGAQELRGLLPPRAPNLALLGMEATRPRTVRCVSLDWFGMCQEGVPAMGLANGRLEVAPAGFSPENGRSTLRFGLFFRLRTAMPISEVPVLMGALSGLTLFTITLSGPLVVRFCSAVPASVGAANAVGTVAGCVRANVLALRTDGLH